jgi:hypothetical protein
MMKATHQTTLAVRLSAQCARRAGCLPTQGKRCVYIIYAARFFVLFIEHGTRRCWKNDKFSRVYIARVEKGGKRGIYYLLMRHFTSNCWRDECLRAHSNLHLILSSLGLCRVFATGENVICIFALVIKPLSKNLLWSPTHKARNSALWN